MNDHSRNRTEQPASRLVLLENIVNRKFHLNAMRFIIKYMSCRHMYRIIYFCQCMACNARVLNFDNEYCAMGGVDCVGVIVMLPRVGGLRNTLKKLNSKLAGRGGQKERKEKEHMVQW